ncbi:MAG: hypothetical protein GY851_15175 [bacterium]|nr:hypothetical protein [bacterium]
MPTEKSYALGALCLALAALMITPVVEAAMSPFNVADHSQLFVDRVLVRDTRNVAFTLHPARTHPGNPIVKADKPWEGWRLEIYGNVIYDEEMKRFRMWYLGEEPDEFPNYGVYYAESEDGVHWEKPLIGTVKSDTYPEHNIIADKILLPSVFRDPSETDPAKRYKMTGFRFHHKEVEEQKYGYMTWVSPDGFTWTQHAKEEFTRGGDVVTGYYDEFRGCYVAFPKIHTKHEGFERRLFYVTTSEDFDTWTESKLAIKSDMRDDAGTLARLEQVRPILDVPDDPKQMRTEFYGVGAYPMESCTLAFVWMFTVNNEARFGNQEGPGEIQLAVSRDLEHWDRPFRTPCVPRGDLGEWDCGFFATQSRALRVGDEVWLYYSGSNYTHGTPCLYRAEDTGRLTEYTSSIGLAIWDLDRFVSVDVPPEGGALTTVPVAFDGTRLEINARVKDGGAITVALLDAAGRPIEGFEQSEAITGDSLRHVVTWDGERDVAALAGKPVVLQFNMKNAELFAFAFRK